MTRYTNNTANNIHTNQKLHMIEGSCWMCLLENQLTARFSSKSAKIATLCSSSLDWCSGAGTRGNGLPTPFSCFDL